MVRRACRIDANQPQMVSDLQSLGFLVIDASGVAQVLPGFPDLILARRGILTLAEIKTEAGDLNGDQVILHRRLESHGVIVPILRTFDDVLKLAGARKTA